MSLSTPSNGDVYTDFQGLAKLKTQARTDSPEAVREVARQFESLFINMVLKSMREASLGDGLMDNDQSKMFQGMYDQQIALDMSKGRGLGLAEVLARQLSKTAGISTNNQEAATGGDLKMPTERVPAVSRQGNAVPTPVMMQAAVSPAAAARPVASPGHAGPWQPETPEQFVRELWPHAEKAARELGTDPEVIIAQAALETGWGKAVMERGDGSSSHNLFGIKADSRWEGDKVVSRTVEYRDGVMHREQASFRAYSSLEESFSDYVNFLKNGNRYQSMFDQRLGTEQYAAALQEAGYATDPRYAEKITQIASGDLVSRARAASEESLNNRTVVEDTHG